MDDREYYGMDARDDWMIKTYNYKGIKLVAKEHKPFGPVMLHEEGPFAKEGKHLHPVVAVVIEDKEGRVLLQRRSKMVTNPGKLDFSAAGHMDYGETLEETAKREAREELGTRIRNLRLLTEKGIRNSVNRMHMLFVIGADTDGRMRLGPEVDPDGTRFYSKDEIAELVKAGSLTSGAAIYFEKARMG